MWENATPTVPSCDDCHARCALCEDDTYKDCDKCNADYFLLDRECLTCTDCNLNLGYYCD